MKHTTILLTFIIFFSCNNNNTVDKRVGSTEDPQSIEPDSTIYMIKMLTGKWEIEKQIYGETEISGNCNPEINFNRDKTAIITFSNGETAYLDWSVNHKQLKIKYRDIKDIGNFFPDTLYQMRFNQENEFVELMLTQKDLDYSYLLK